MIKLAHKNIETIIEFVPDKFNVLQVENQEYFSQLIEEMVFLTNLEKSGFVLSENGEEFNKFEVIEFCSNYFVGDFGSKKINAILTKQMINFLKTRTLELNEIFSSGFKLVNEIIDKKFDSEIILNDEIDVTMFLKMYSPQICFLGDTLLEKMIMYVNNLVEFCGLKVFITISLKDFLTQEQLESFFQHCENKEVSILNFQAHDSYVIKNERSVIIDNDLCEIVKNY